MITGISSAHAARRVATTTDSRPSPSCLPQPLRRQYRYTNSIRAPPISSPGPNPAMNNSPIETSAATPYRIIGIDGGMTTPSSALVACSAAAHGRGYPCLISAGIRIAPIANVVATDEPETAAKIMQVSTHVIGSPPCTPPTSDFAKSTRRREMPPLSIRLPARIKNGIAANGKRSIAVNISFGIAIHGSSVKPAMPTRPESPIATATEIENANASSMVTSIAIDMRALPYR